MNWSVSVVLILMGVLVKLSAQSDDLERTKRQVADDCEPKYRNFNPKHTRCAKPYPGAKLTRLSEAVRKEILDVHHQYRANIQPPAANMMKLVWDDNLAQSAEKLVMQCKFEHDDMTQRMEPDWPMVGIGQNLGKGHSSFTAMIDRFYSEKDRYNYTYGKGYLDDAGHFFQVVAHQTTRIGCAEATCPDLDAKVLRLCNYAPVMNAAEPPYERGEPCSVCPNHCDKTLGKLCDCQGKLCYFGGKLDPSTCTCKCPELRTGSHCEELDCKRNDPEFCFSHPSSDCGRTGSMLRDKSLCPHLCGLCGSRCQGVVCKNGGILDYETCTCNCLRNFQGKTCEDCPAKDHPGCSTNYLPEICHTHRTLKYACPIFCRACKSKCKPCENHGDLDTKTCKCTCMAPFHGDQCEKCPETEEDFCNLIPKHVFYTGNVASQFRMQSYCPYTTGLCKRS